MKLKILIVALLFTHILNAQTKYNFELHSGTNFLQVIKTNDTIYSINPKLGFQAGINIERKIKNNFTIGTGFRYLINKYDVKDIVFDHYDIDTVALYDISGKNIYFQIPVFVKYSFQTNNKLFTPYLKAGINNVFFVKMKSKGVNFRISEDNYPEYFNDLFVMLETPNELRFKDIINKYQFNPFLSAGLSLNVSEKINTGLDVSYQIKTGSFKYNTIDGIILLNAFFSIKI